MAAAAATAARQKSVVEQHKVSNHKQGPAIIGRSRKSLNGVNQSNVITAAKPYIGKATFCIDNVSTSVTAESLARFVAEMDIFVWVRNGGKRKSS